MFGFLTKLLLVVRSRLKSRARLEAENIVLRRQVIVLSCKSQSRVRLRNLDRLIRAVEEWVVRRTTDSLYPCLILSRLEQSGCRHERGPRRFAEGDPELHAGVRGNDGLIEVFHSLDKMRLPQDEVHCGGLLYGHCGELHASLRYRFSRSKIKPPARSA